MKIAVCGVLLTSLALAGCETTGPKQQGGAVLGAVVGGVIGSQLGGDTEGRILAGLAGAAVGGLIGSSIGAQLDAQDRKRLEQITLSSMSTGSVRSFRNPKTGVKATTRVVKSSTSGGQACRTVQQDVVLADGRIARDTVRGCKGKNGWSV